MRGHPEIITHLANKTRQPVPVEHQHCIRTPSTRHGCAVRSMKTIPRFVLAFLILARGVAPAQDLLNSLPIPDPILTHFDEFNFRLQAAVQSGEVANIRALYHTNGITSEELNSEL